MRTVQSNFRNFISQQVVSQSVGALAELSSEADVCEALLVGDGLPKLVNLLRGTDPHLLLNVTRAVR